MAGFDETISRGKTGHHGEHVFASSFTSRRGSAVRRIIGGHGGLSVQHAERSVVGEPDSRIRSHQNAVLLLRHISGRVARRRWGGRTRLAVCFGAAKRG